MKSLFALALLLLTSTAAQADAGLDLVLLVDRSVSMHRDRHLSSLFLRIAVDLVARNAAANHVEHRIGIVSFGSSARVDVPLGSGALSERTRLRERIDALPAAHLGQTNFLAAFTAAKQLLGEVPPDSARRRSVVLLTDGFPYVRGVEMHAHRAALRTFIANLQRQRISIDVVLLDASSQALWRGMATSVQIAGRAPDVLLAQAHHVVSRLVGTLTTQPRPMTARVDVLTVPPYLDVIVFDVFRGSADADVEIIPPASSTPIRGGSEDVEAVRVGSVLATYVVPRPRPGRWMIRKSHADARVRIVSQQFFPRGLLVRPEPTEALRQYDRPTIAYRLLDAHGQPLRELSDYALSLELSVARPDGVRSRVKMERAVDLGTGVFRGAEASELPLAGRYWTDVKVTTIDAAGRKLDVFHDRWSGFSVSPAARVDCRVKASGTTAWLPMTTEVACVDAKERAVDLSAIAIGSPIDLFRAILWRDGRRADATLDLESAGVGSFRGRLRGASRSGSYKLQLIADRARLRPTHNIRFIPPELTFTRSASLEWAAASVAIASAVAVATLLKSRRAEP